MQDVHLLQVEVHGQVENCIEFKAIILHTIKSVLLQVMHQIPKVPKVHGRTLLRDELLQVVRGQAPSKRHEEKEIKVSEVSKVRAANSRKQGAKDKRK